MLTIRRLNSPADVALYEAAWQWNLDAPRWVRDCAKVFEAADFPKFLAQASDPARVDVGVWEDGQFTGLITLVLRATGIYEAYLAAKRGASLDHFGAAIEDVKAVLTANGMVQTFVWIAAQNRAILNLCEAAGFQPTGLEMYKGATHGRPIRWRQMNYVTSLI
jgi:hypothetical protein